MLTQTLLQKPAWLDEHIGNKANGEWADLRAWDWVVVSMSFAGTGGEHLNLKNC